MDMNGFRTSLIKGLGLACFAQAPAGVWALGTSGPRAHSCSRWPRIRRRSKPRVFVTNRHYGTITVDVL